MQYPILTAALVVWLGSFNLALTVCGAGATNGGKTVLSIEGTQFRLNGSPAFLLGISYYSGLGAPEEFIRKDLDDVQRHGFNWLRVWATWGGFDHDVSAVDASGRAREPFLGKLRWLVAECDRRGLVVDVTLTRGRVTTGATPGGRLPDFESHQRAVETLVAALRPHRNWYLDLGNERDVRDARYVPPAELKVLRELVRRLDPPRLVTASFGGHDLSEQDVREALLTIGLDFLSPHRPRDRQSPGQTEAKTRECLDLMKKVGRVAPVHHQEPFRRGYSPWEPGATDFLTDLRGAVAGGAAGWCFHNGSQRTTPDNEPRRSFDLRAKRLFDQLDVEEQRVVREAAAQAPPLPRLKASDEQRFIEVPAAKPSAALRIGTVELPADCALARREHPRLLFTKAEVPGIRARNAKPGLRDIYDRFKRTVDAQMAKGTAHVQLQGAARMLVPLGLLYHITGEAEYGEACRALTLKAPFGVYATEGVYGYDLVYDLLSPEERRQCESKMIEFIQRPYPDGNVFIQCVALWGSGNRDDLVAQKLSQMHAWCLKRKAYLNDWAADRGGDGNSHGYIGQHEYVGTMGAFQAWRAATGEDWFDGFNWAKTMGPYYVYHLLPNRRLTVNVGINSWGGRHAPIETGAEDFVSIAQAKWQCGLTGWWTRHVVCGDTAYYNILHNDWGMVLFHDPDVPDLAPEQFPQDMLFKTRGYVAMRSDWSTNATFVHFHCGRFETDGRNQCDNNSFIIYRKAYLACDSGTRGVNNPEQKQYSDGKHHENYFAQTIAHNSITVGTNRNPSPLCRTVFGGQVSRVPLDWLRKYGLPAIDDNRWSRQAGTLQAYETTPEFCYAVGDARCSYDPDVVQAFTRQFVYLRPGVIVIFDRVRAAKPQDVKRWYLHTMAQPLCLDGQLTPDTRVHPDGHFLATGRVLRSAHGGSALFSRTLLPRRATLRVLGGKGHQFEVADENCDMYDLWWQKVGTRAYQEEIGIGWWRVEVEPEEPQAEEVFLHVLWATDDTVQEMFPVSTIAQDGLAGARFSADGLEVEVAFATHGDLSGRIKLARGANVICDRPLAARVEDDYRKWSRDPRYQAWTTHPHTRAVIGQQYP